LPQPGNQSAVGWLAPFVRHFPKREPSSDTNRREAGPDFHSLRKDCSAQSRADCLFRTTHCRRRLQTEPRQTFGDLWWTGARQSRHAAGSTKTATGNHRPIVLIRFLLLGETCWPSAARIRLTSNVGNNFRAHDGWVCVLILSVSLCFDREAKAQATTVESKEIHNEFRSNSHFSDSCVCCGGPVLPGKKFSEEQREQ